MCISVFIQLLDVVKHYRELPHQTQAIKELQNQLERNHPELLRDFAHTWRNPAPRPSNLEDALKFTLKWEGGYSDHPADSGGKTMKGITQSVYSSYLIRNKRAIRPVHLITDAEVKDIYGTSYWSRGQCPRMSAPLNIAHFDTCVNFGVAAAFSFLSEALGMGLIYTWEPIEQRVLAANPKELALKVVQCRIKYRHQRVKDRPSQKAFLEGWLNRDNDLKKLVESY